MNVTHVDALECLLFVADGPVNAALLAQALELDEFEVNEALDGLKQRLNKGSGLQLVQLAGGFQLSTKPQFAASIARFLQPQKSRLSKPALETLAIIAYRQPITLLETEEIRGVSCDGIMRSLVERRMVREMGRKETMGRPILYGTTQEFLHQFGLNEISELPPILELQETVR